MKINIANLKTEITKLNKLIDEYEEIFLNLYNELSSSSIYWEDKISKSYFENITTEKLQVKNTISELNDIKNIYEEIINKYEEFGNKIQVIPKNKNLIFSKINNYLDNLYETIEIYHELDLTFCPTEATKLYKHMDNLIKIGNNLVELKEKIKKSYEAIEEIEKTINLKLSKIKIEYIKETEINRFI